MGEGWSFYVPRINGAGVGGEGKKCICLLPWSQHTKKTNMWYYLWASSAMQKMFTRIKQQRCYTAQTMHVSITCYCSVHIFKVDYRCEPQLRAFTTESQLCVLVKFNLYHSRSHCQRWTWKKRKKISFFLSSRLLIYFTSIVFFLEINLSFNSLIYQWS